MKPSETIDILIEKFGDRIPIARRLVTLVLPTPEGLAIDFEDHDYLAQIFGAPGYVYVRDPHAMGRQLIRSIASMLGT